MVNTRYKTTRLHQSSKTLELLSHRCFTMFHHQLVEMADKTKIRILLSKLIAVYSRQPLKRQNPINPESMQSQSLRTPLTLTATVSGPSIAP